MGVVLSKNIIHRMLIKVSLNLHSTYIHSQNDEIPQNHVIKDTVCI